MDFFSMLTDTAILTVLGMAFGSILTFLASRGNTKKDLFIHDREQLSKDTYQFINELKDLIQEQGEDLDSLKAEVKTLQEVNAGLTREVAELQKINLSLMVENKELQFKVEKLSQNIDTFNNRGE